jgi:peroxiredoxin Q/BCP
MLAHRITGRFLASVLLASVLNVASVATAVEVGEKAPDFTLPSTTGKDISLSEFLGKKYVLIEFYGGDFDPTCAKNLSTRKVDFNKFQDLDVQILGISGNAPFSQKAFADSLKLPYPLLSDMEQNAATKAYGVVSENKWRRSFFLIDKQGIIRGQWHGEDEGVFSNKPLLKAAQEIAEKPVQDTGAKKASGM